MGSNNYMAIFCFNVYNADHLEIQVYEALNKLWICDREECWIKYLKTNNDLKFNKLLIKHHGNELMALKDYQNQQSELVDYEGDFC